MTNGEAGPPKQGAFISHITSESPVALILQEFLLQAYTNDFPVFVLSHKRSIPGGEAWWQHIRDSIKEREVLLVLLSDESAGREWINFETGVADGSGAKVIPVAIKGYRFDKLDFPLKGFMGRYVADLEGILYDINRWTNRSALPLDKAAYLTEMTRAEESVMYKNLMFRPIRTTLRGHPKLMFELANTGNVDIDLLFAEVRFPHSIQAQQTVMQEAPPTLEIDRTPEGSILMRYYSVPNNVHPDIRRLEPTITRSMGNRRLRDLRVPLKADSELDMSAVIRYQIHAREMDTEPQTCILGDIPVVPEKCE